MENQQMAGWGNPPGKAYIHFVYWDAEFLKLKTPQ